MKSPHASDFISQVTRREWLLCLGETVALAGVSGLVPETSLRLFGGEQSSTVLPPGLYDPSSDQLVHALSSHKRFAPPAGSETDYVQPGVPYALQFFSADEFRTIRSLVSVLLGNIEDTTLTETAQWVDLWFHSAEGVRDAARNLDPLHRALAAAYFGESSVTEIENSNPAADLRKGLAALRKLCLDEHHRPFADLDTPQQQEIVRRSSSAAIENPLRTFYELLRHEAIRGYYSSAEGLKELDYKGNAYHPYCPGCEAAKS
jgi:Gluconate 2-dehydrogenase subunit 3